MSSNVPVAEIAVDPPTAEERSTAMLCWLLNIFIHILGPWLFWHLSGRKSAFATHHFNNCVNHVLTLLILTLIVCLVFAAPILIATYTLENQPDVVLWLLIGSSAGMGLGFVALWSASLVIQIVAAMKASSGQWWTPPMCWRMSRIQPRE